MKNKYVIGVFYKYFFTEFFLFLIDSKFSSQKLINNIIYLGGENFRYNHFSMNTKGDMIVDTTAFPGNNERRFFGLKKNGRPYFHENNIETPYRTLFASGLENVNQQKTGGESSFIILSKKNDSNLEEYLLSFSKEEDYIELYDFDNNLIISKKSSKYFSKTIVSDVCTFFKAESRKDDKYNYYIAYIYLDKSSFKFYVQRNYFTVKNITQEYHKDTGSSKSTLNKTIISCFETESKKIVCFYQNEKNYKYNILTFNESFVNTSQSYTQLTQASTEYNLFYKAIHLKKEIGAFIYFVNNDDKSPILSLKICHHEDNIFYDYNNFGNVELNKKEFNSNAMLNDIIKINDNKICYFAPSPNKESLNIVIFFIYNDDNNMMIRYYSYEMFNEYKFKFFNDLKAFLYNDFISMAFSYCLQSQCENNEDKHFSSLIIFNYPNSTTDNHFDFTKYIYENNKIEGFYFSLDENISYEIENNIFGYIYKGIKILNYPNYTYLIYKTNENIIENNSYLVENQMVSLVFSTNETFEGKNYTIEYAIVLTDPDYSKINEYTSDLDKTYYSSKEEAYYQKSEYIGRSIFYNISIKEDLFSQCDDKCSLCYKRDFNSCIICRYNYTFNGEEKICFSKILPQTTILTPETTILQTTQLFTTLLFTPITTVISSPYSSIIESSSQNTHSLSLEENYLFSTSISKPSIFSSNSISLPKQSLITSTYPKLTTIKNIPSTIKNIPTSIVNKPTTIINMPTSINNISTTINNKPTTTINMQTTIINMPTTINNKQTTIINIQTTIINIPTTIINMPTSINNKITTINNMQTSINNIPTTINNIQKTSIYINPNSKTTLIKAPTIIDKTVPISEENIESKISQSLNSFISSEESLRTSNLESKFTTSILTSNIIMKKSNLLTSASDGLSSLSEVKPSSYSSIIINKTIKTSINKLPFSSNEVIISKTNSNEEIKCTNQEIIDGECNDIITKEQIEKIYQYLKDNIIKNNSNSSIIIESKNVIFQVSSLESQKNNNANISSIDLGDCEQILKDKENLTDNGELIIFKIDIKNDDSSLTYVQFEIYNSQNTKQLSLDDCQDIPIIIKSPINLDESFDSIFISLKSSGYDLLNLNDSFYSDICSTYTSENGTDICMSGRKTLVYDKNSNISFCQSGCYFISYDYTNKKSICECEIQKEEIITNSSKISFNTNEFVDHFYKTIKNSNFLVMKCYKLVFSKRGLSNNKGSYIIFSLEFIFIILSIWNCITGKNTLDRYIIEFLQNKVLYSHENNNKKDVEKKKNESSIRLSKKSDKKEFDKSSKKNLQSEIKAFKRKNSQFKSTMKTKKINNKNLFDEFKRVNIKRGKSQKIILNQNFKKFQLNNKNINVFINHNLNMSENKKKPHFPPIKKRHLSKKLTRLESNSRNQLLISFNMSKASSTRDSNNNLLLKNSKSSTFINKNNKKMIINFNNKTKHIDHINGKSKENELLIKNRFNDEELNYLDYKTAIIFDKRTYFQYYWSLIKKKQIFVFTFINQNDYNLIQIKICLLLLAFALYFTINGFFFTDETMNNIYENKGYYNIIYHIPQILYSTLISVIVNTIFKTLSLSENQMLSIKKERNINEAKKLTFKIRKILKIKIIFFYIIGFLFLFFFWYFISCFCAVYKNTQNILIKDTLLSFGLSMIYPFGINLFPGMFRIPSLKAKKKNKKCLYNIGNLLSLI